MLHPTFIASHPSGFSEPEHREAHFESKAFIQTRQCLFEGEQDCFYCLCVGSLQSSEQGEGKPCHSSPAASDTELENTNRTKCEEELDKGAGNCKREVSAPRRPTLVWEAAHKRNLAPPLPSNLHNILLKRDRMQRLDSFIWSGKKIMCERITSLFVIWILIRF